MVSEWTELARTESSSLPSQPPSSLRCICCIHCIHVIIMPSKKRRRPATAEDGPQRPSSIHSKHRAPLASFSSLPRELRQMIVEVACASPRSSAASPGRSPFALVVDMSAVYNLALVCKELKEQVTPLLWRTVTITRPSALHAVQQALLTGPQRGNPITSLHIGPQDVLLSYWWPLSSVCLEGDSKYASTAGQSEFNSYWWIASSLEQDALPFDCSTRQPWRCNSRAAGCRGAAVYEALQVIQKTLGLKLVQRGRREQRAIGLVFAAQAALDLYLEKIRLLEVQKPELIELAKKPRAPLQCRNGSCDHYPSLQLKDMPSSAGITSSGDRSQQPTSPHNAIVLRYAGILEHMARPGAPTDRFDHPLIFERSGVQVIVNNPARKGPQTYYPSQASYQIGNATWSRRQHGTFRWPASATSPDAAKQFLSTGTGTSRRGNASSGAAATSTIDCVVEVALDVLNHTTKLENLSLTGYLPAVISSWQERTVSSLRRCSVGPTMPGWDPRLGFPRLKTIEELRLCGVELTEAEARTVAQLSRLKKLDLVLGAWQKRGRR